MKELLSKNINLKTFFITVFSFLFLLIGGFFVYAKTITLGNTSSDILYIISKVGIGTTTPNYPLEVTGDVGWSGVLQKGSVPWSRLISFPSDCPSGQYAYGIGAGLKCLTPPPGGAGGAASCPAGQAIRSFDLSTGSVVCDVLPQGPQGDQGDTGLAPPPTPCTYSNKTYTTGTICSLGCAYYQDDVGEPCFTKPPNFEYYQACQSNGSWTYSTHCVNTCASTCGR